MPFSHHNSISCVPGFLLPTVQKSHWVQLSTMCISGDELQNASSKAALIKINHYFSNMHYTFIKEVFIPWHILLITLIIKLFHTLENIPNSKEMPVQDSNIAVENTDDRVNYGFIIKT